MPHRPRPVIRSSGSGDWLEWIERQDNYYNGFKEIADRNRYGSLSGEQVRVARNHFSDNTAALAALVKVQHTGKKAGKEKFKGEVLTTKPEFTFSRIRHGSKYVQVKRDSKGRFASLGKPQRFSQLNKERRIKYGMRALEQ